MKPADIFNRYQELISQRKAELITEAEYNSSIANLYYVMCKDIEDGEIVS